MIVTTGAMALCLVLQSWALHRLRPARLIGDEQEYAQAVPPPMPWVRVPLNRFVMRGAVRVTGGSDPLGARVASSVIATLVLGLAVGWVELRAGPFAALIVALVLLTSIERALLALHLWPDTALGGLWLAAALLMAPGGAQAAPHVALIGGIAMGLRIDGLAICVLAVGVGLIFEGGGLEPALLAGLIAAGFGIAYLVWNRIMTGRWVLDSTIGFNLSVFHADAAGRFDSINQVMRHVATGRRDGRGTGAARHSPVVILRRLAARLRLLFGSETFLSQTVVAQDGAGYRDSGGALRHPFAVALLRWHFPILGLVTLPVLPSLPGPWLFVAALISVILCLLVTRSRYRMALLPLLAVSAVEGWRSVLEAGSISGLWSGGLLLALFGVILTTAPRLRER